MSEFDYIEQLCMHCTANLPLVIVGHAELRQFIQIAFVDLTENEGQRKPIVFMNTKLRQMAD